MSTYNVTGVSPAEAATASTCGSSYQQPSYPLQPSRNVYQNLTPEPPSSESTSLIELGTPVRIGNAPVTSSAPSADVIFVRDPFYEPPRKRTPNTQRPPQYPNTGNPMYSGGQLELPRLAMIFLLQGSSSGFIGSLYISWRRRCLFTQLGNNEPRGSFDHRFFFCFPYYRGFFHKFGFFIRRCEKFACLSSDTPCLSDFLLLQMFESSLKSVFIETLEADVLPAFGSIEHVCIIATICEVLFHQGVQLPITGIPPVFPSELLGF